MELEEDDFFEWLEAYEILQIDNEIKMKDSAIYGRDHANTGILQGELRNLQIERARALGLEIPYESTPTIDIKDFHKKYAGRW